MTRRRDITLAAFTIVELFVVIAITAIVVTIATPSVTSLIRSSQRSLSSNALLVGVTVARDLAQRENLDTAAVILRDEGGPVRIAVMVKVGELDDFEQALDPFNPAVTPQEVPTVRREVFAPVPDAPAIELSETYSVAGYAAPYTMQPLGTVGEDQGPTWYDVDFYGGDSGTGTGLLGIPPPQKLEGNWVLPLSGYYDPTSAGGGLAVAGGAGPTGTPRHTFMLRFKAGTGELIVGGAPVLCVDPRPALHSVNDFPAPLQINPINNAPRNWWRADQADSLFDWSRSVLNNDADDYWGGVESDDARRAKRSGLIGLYSNDTVLAAGVSRLALFRTDELASALGARGLNAITGTVFEPFGKSQRIAFDTGGPATAGGVRYRNGVLAGSAGQDEFLRRRINQWIDGDTNFNDMLFDEGGTGVPPDAPRAQLFKVEPLTGELREVVR